MQNFTGTGFSNEEIKKEDIVKQIKSKEDAIDNMHRLTGLATQYGIKKFLQGTTSGKLFEKDGPQKQEQSHLEAQKAFDEFKKLNLEIIKYLEAMPHD
tara:strand:- start:1114 stop:1407 length:294 start_codon:yes stop_codon:yes gene_type:complete